MHLTLVKKMPEYLSRREDTQKKQEAVFRVLDSVLKTRKSKLRDRYVSELKAMISNLCVQSTDLLRAKEQRKEVEKRLETSERKRTQFADRCAELEYQLHSKS